MKVILFIGHHKVGSSSLQRFLAQNQGALLRAGILYPSVESQGFCQNLKTALGAGGPGPRAPLNVLEPHNALAFRMLADAGCGPVPAYHPGLPHSWQMWRAIDSQIAAFSPRALILCAEVFANFPAAGPQPLQVLARALSGREVRILCTLRRPDDYLVAWHGQRLKFGHRLTPLRQGAQRQYYKTVHFDYAMMLAGWRAAFPEAEILLRSYDEVRAAGGAIADFLDRAGVRFPQNLPRPPDANRSLARAFFEVARRANHELSAPAARSLRDFLLALPNMPFAGEDRQTEMFGEQNRAELVTRFAPVERALAESFRAGAPLFGPPEAMATPRPHPEMLVARAALARLARVLPSQPLGAEERAFLAGLDLG